MPSDDTRTMNQARWQRAQAALSANQWTLRATQEGWTVQTPTGRYRLRPGPTGQDWTCTCQDYRLHAAKGVRCKHIQALVIDDRPASRSGSPEAAPNATQADQPIQRPSQIPPTLAGDNAMATYEEIKQALEQPFGLDQLRFKPQFVPKGPDGKPKPKGKCLVAAYAHIRAYVERLDQAAGGQWHDQVEELLTTQNKLVVNLQVSIADIHHSNLGEAPLAKENAATIAYAQAFKRACADHGLGAYLYKLTDLWVPYQLKPRGQVELLEQPLLPSWANPDTPSKNGDPQKGRTGSSGKPEVLSMSISQAQETICPIKTDAFPDIQGKALGDLRQEHPESDRIFRYLASEAFLKTATSPPRNQAHFAARILLNHKTMPSRQ